MSEDPRDPFSRSNYRSLIAWPARIRREGPFLARVLAEIPHRSVADLGCGTGEHSRHLASKGFRVAGLDVSESMLADATEEPLPPNLSFHLGDLQDAEAILGGGFGAALILGNTVAFLESEDGLLRAFRAVFRILLPGGRFLFQILNYEKFYARKVRYLPLNFNDTAEGTVIFLRLFELREGGKVLFFPTTLKFLPDHENPLEIVRTRKIEHRAWTRKEIFPALEETGFKETELFGDMEGGPFNPGESQDLVVLARKPQ